MNTITVILIAQNIPETAQINTMNKSNQRNQSKKWTG